MPFGGLTLGQLSQQLKIYTKMFLGWVLAKLLTVGNTLKLLKGSRMLRHAFNMHSHVRFRGAFCVAFSSLGCRDIFSTDMFSTGHILDGRILD